MCELINLFNTDIIDDKEKDMINNAYALLPQAPDTEIITQISATSYERNECKEKNLVFIPALGSNRDSVPKIDVDIHISSQTNIEFSFSNVRLLRKMLQPIDKSHCLVLGQENGNLYKVIGIASLSEILKKYQCYVFTIKKHMTWYLRIGETDILGYCNGKYKNVYDIENKIDKKDAIAKLKELLPDFNEVSFKILIDTLIEQNHGTSFVIFKSDKKAMGEAKRLASQKAGRGFLLSPILNFSATNMSQITDIDGGLIFDLEANCYAYGCIFDGKVPKEFEGNSGRGSRYNSIKLYVQTTKNCVGVIYSDDQTIDIISAIC
ncbi:MAG: hypothetical protein IJ428_02420 [Clostridia bacterium]|nr:hypothetical protein [Clostridia bacterium]